MDNERPGERTLWSSRLEEPGALPGVGLTDKEATWDKLYDRLRETPRRRALPWLWTAAACLLLALIPAAFLLREKKVIPRSSTPRLVVQPKMRSSRTDQPPTSASDLVPSVVIRNTPPIPVPPTASATPLHPARRGRPAHTIKNPVPSLAPLVSKAPAQPGQLLPSVPDQPQPVTVSALATPKKELRVVHINELEPQRPEPGMVTGPRQKPRRLQIRFNPEQEVIRPATTYQTYQTDHPDYRILSF